MTETSEKSKEYGRVGIDTREEVRVLESGTERERERERERRITHKGLFGNKLRKRVTGILSRAVRPFGKEFERAKFP